MRKMRGTNWVLVVVMALVTGLVSQAADHEPTKKSLSDRLQDRLGAFQIPQGFQNLPEKLNTKAEIDGSLVVGTEFMKDMGAEMNRYLRSREGKQFLHRYKSMIIYGDEEQAKEFQKKFIDAFEEWAAKYGLTKQVRTGIKNYAVKLHNMTKDYIDGKFNLKLYYSSNVLKRAMSRIVDTIAHELAWDIAYKARGGRIGTRFMAGAIRRASQHRARLRIVQGTYDAMKAGIIRKLESTATATVESKFNQAMKENDVDAKLNLIALERTKTKGPYSKDSYAVVSLKHWAVPENVVARMKLPDLDQIPATATSEVSRILEK